MAVRKSRCVSARCLRALIGFAGLLGALSVGLNRADAALTLSAGSDTVFVGDTFSIPISIANASGLTSFQFDLSFDHALLRVLSFDDSATDFATAATSGGGSLTGLTGFVDNSTGLLSGVADSMFTFGSGLTPSGSLVDITFQALAVGVSPLTLSNSFLTDGGLPLSSANGDFGLNNGEVTILARESVPEPNSLLLLGATLLGLALLCRRRSRARA